MEDDLEHTSNADDEQNPYSRSLVAVISFMLDHHTNLLVDGEVYLLRNILELSENEKKLAARLVLRKAPWVKGISLLHYLSRRDENSDPHLVFSALDSLVKKRLVNVLCKSTPFEAAFEAVRSCMLVDELAALLRCLSSNMNSPHISGKTQLLEAIRSAALKQKTLFGQSLTHKFAELACGVMRSRSSSGSSGSAERGGWSGTRTTARGGAGSSKLEPRRDSHAGVAGQELRSLIVRISPHVAHLLRRCQRLFQISCNTGYGTAGSSAAVTTMGASLSSSLSSATTVGLASVLLPLEFNAPLLVAFGKVRYPSYPLHAGGHRLNQFHLNSESRGNGSVYCSSNGNGSNRQSINIGADSFSLHDHIAATSVTGKSNIFQSRRHFLQWEGAVEIYAACISGELAQAWLKASEGGMSLSTADVTLPSTALPGRDTQSGETSKFSSYNSVEKPGRIAISSATEATSELNEDGWLSASLMALFDNGLFSDIFLRGVDLHRQSHPDLSFRSDPHTSRSCSSCISSSSGGLMQHMAVNAPRCSPRWALRGAARVSDLAASLGLLSAQHQTASVRAAVDTPVHIPVDTSVGGLGAECKRPLPRPHMLAILAMLSYCAEYGYGYKNNADCDIAAVREEGAEVRGEGNVSGGVSNPDSLASTPRWRQNNKYTHDDVMIKFDAGTQLAYACGDAAATCEKEAHRNYVLAILLYELLLRLPFLAHRRGCWLKRLTIDYEHLKLTRCALRAAYRGMLDGLVNVSDKTDLESRAAALSKKCLKTHAPTAAVGKAKGNGKRKGHSTAGQVEATRIVKKKTVNGFAGSTDNAGDRFETTISFQSSAAHGSEATSQGGPTDTGGERLRRSQRGKADAARKVVHPSPATATATASTSSIVYAVEKSDVPDNVANMNEQPAVADGESCSISGISLHGVYASAFAVENDFKGAGTGSLTVPLSAEQDMPGPQEMKDASMLESYLSDSSAPLRVLNTLEERRTCNSNTSSSSSSDSRGYGSPAHDPMQLITAQLLCLLLYRYHQHNSSACMPGDAPTTITAPGVTGMSEAGAEVVFRESSRAPPAYTAAASAHLLTRKELPSNSDGSDMAPTERSINHHGPKYTKRKIDRIISNLPHRSVTAPGCTMAEVEPHIITYNGSSSGKPLTKSQRTSGLGEDETSTYGNGTKYAEAGDVVIGNWTCNWCTFINTAAAAVICSMCNQQRVIRKHSRVQHPLNLKPAKKRKPAVPSSSSSAPAARAPSDGIAASFKLARSSRQAAEYSALGTKSRESINASSSVVSSVVIDLVSDEEDVAMLGPVDRISSKSPPPPDLPAGTKGTATGDMRTTGDEPDESSQRIAFETIAKFACGQIALQAWLHCLHSGRDDSRYTAKLGTAEVSALSRTVHGSDAGLESGADAGAGDRCGTSESLLRSYLDIARSPSEQHLLRLLGALNLLYVGLEEPAIASLNLAQKSAQKAAHRSDIVAGIKPPSSRNGRNDGFSTDLSQTEDRSTLPLGNRIGKNDQTEVEGSGNSDCGGGSGGGCDHYCKDGGDNGDGTDVDDDDNFVEDELCFEEEEDLHLLFGSSPLEVQKNSATSLPAMDISRDSSDAVKLARLQRLRAVCFLCSHSNSSSSSSPSCSISTSSSGGSTFDSLIPAPQFFVVHAQRFGDTSRKGKNRFLGDDDELVNVETLVLQKCYKYDDGDIALEDGELLEWGEGEPPVTPAAPAPAPALTPLKSRQVPYSAVLSLSTSEAQQSIQLPSLDPDTHTTGSKRTPAAPAPAPVPVPTAAAVVGGWQGWHCEGSVLRMLFALFFWDILFDENQPDKAPTEESMRVNESSGSMNRVNSARRESLPLSAPPSTQPQKHQQKFITPFQDCPLDLGHRSFYKNRRGPISRRLSELHSASPEQLCASLGRCYRQHHGQTCRGMSWSTPLPLLQLVAVCMGGAGVSTACRTLAVNYKHFSAGAPDLLLLRVTEWEITASIPCMESNSKGKHSHSSQQVEQHDQQPRRRLVRVLDLAELLGQDWSDMLGGYYRGPGNSFGAPRATHAAIPPSLSNRHSGQPEGRAIGTRPSDAGRGSSLITDPDPGRETEVDPDRDVNRDSEAATDPDGNAANDDDDDMPEVRHAKVLAADGSYLKPQAPPKLSSSNGDVHGSREQIYDLQLPSTAPHSSITNVDANVNTNEKKLSGSYEQVRREFRFESLFVEVKGPSDHLAFRQRAWLHMLSSSSSSSASFSSCCCSDPSQNRPFLQKQHPQVSPHIKHGIHGLSRSAVGSGSASSMRALVCHVKEKSVSTHR